MPIMEVLGCKCFFKKGYEADDIMATLSKWGRERWEKNSEIKGTGSKMWDEGEECERKVTDRGLKGWNELNWIEFNLI